MSHDVVFLIRQVLRHRRRLIAWAFAVVVPLVILGVRFKEVPFTATIKLFVAPPSASPLGKGLGVGGLGGGLSVLERDTIISGQETLALSRLVFGKVRQKMAANGESREPTPPSPIRQFTDPLSRLLFGDSYVTLRKTYIDWDYLNFKDRLLFQPDMDSGSFSLSYSSRDPDVARKTANYLADALIEVNQDLERERSDQSLKVLSEKIEETRRELDASSRKIVEFVKASSFPGNDRYLELTYETYVKAVEREQELKAQLRAMDVQVQGLEQADQALTKTLSDSVGSGRSSRVEALLAELGRYETARAQLAEGAPGSEQLAAAMDDLRLRLRQASDGLKGDEALGVQALKDVLTQLQLTKQKARVDRVSLKATASAQAGRVEQAKEAVDRIPENQAELSQLTASHAQLGQVLALVTEQYYRTLIERDFDSAGIHVVEDAAIAPGSISSKKSVVLLAVLVMAMVAILVTFAVREGLRGTLFSRTQLESQTSISHSLYMPRLQKYELKDILGTYFRNEGVVGFADRLRRLIVRFDPQGGIKVLVVTGATPEIGKSVTSLLTALCFHRKNFRVALLDADYRAQRRNLKDIANGLASSQVVGNVEELNRMIRTYDAGDGNQPLLAKLKYVEEISKVGFDAVVGEMVRTLRGRFDLVIVDGPPIFFSDTLALVDTADAMMLCVRQGQSTIVELSEAMAMLSAHRSTPIPVVGVMTDAVAPQGANLAATYRQGPYGSTRRAA